MSGLVGNVLGQKQGENTPQGQVGETVGAVTDQAQGQVGETTKVINKTTGEVLGVVDQAGNVVDETTGNVIGTVQDQAGGIAKVIHSRGELI
jgi:hypothetical protein